MATTTEYGSWTFGNNASLEDTVSESLGDFVEDYDFDALVREYRDAISAALPGGVVLAGETFYGPYPRAERYWDAITDAVHGVDFWAIAARHEKGATEN